MHRLAPLPFAIALVGCPSHVEHHIGEDANPALPLPDESDPRVVRDGEDLYPARVFEKNSGGDQPQARGLGSGKPDETNGKCRLYAPELAEPECCAADLGFDVAAVSEACGLELFLGESFHFSCGYYFHKPDGSQPWFRTSFVLGSTAREAASDHDRKMRRTARDDAFASTPVPGAPGAYWSTHDGVGWAFIPGWSQVRQLAWKQSGCSPEGIAKLVSTLIAAKQPPPNAPRQSLLPTAHR